MMLHNKSATGPKETRNLAPQVYRQRLLIEATYKRTVSKANVERYLRELPGELNLRICNDPVVYSPGGEGKQVNQGYDGFVALIDSGIAICVWENAKLVAAVVYTCKEFDEAKAINFTREFFEATELEQMSF
jgi:S-adenosylmethionine/arginine decarboxylase-like enzyme